jgi:hypothetical protein
MDGKKDDQSRQPPGIPTAAREHPSLAGATNQTKTAGLLTPGGILVVA